MPKIKDAVSGKDIHFVAKTLLDPHASGGDMILDLFSGFTSTRPYLIDPPPHVVEAVAGWLADCEVAERDE